MRSAPPPGGTADSFKEEFTGMTANKLASALAIGAIAVLPACSMMGNRSGEGIFGQSNSSNRTAAGTTSSSVTTQQSAVSPEMIKAVQQKMQHDGEYHGNIDGVWGPDTQTAVRDYQRAHNLNVTGQLDQQTLQAMDLQNTSNTNYSNARSSGPSGSQASSNYNNPNNTHTNYNNTNTSNNPGNNPSSTQNR
jgi:peptidoglycan hydrolase-like protein with peptidoglycan-binding domain